MKAFRALTGKTSLAYWKNGFFFFLFIFYGAKMKIKQWLNTSGQARVESPGDTLVQFEQKPLFFFLFFYTRKQLRSRFFSTLLELFVKMDH